MTFQKLSLFVALIAVMIGAVVLFNSTSVAETGHAEATKQVKKVVQHHGHDHAAKADKNVCKDCGCDQQCCLGTSAKLAVAVLHSTKGNDAHGKLTLELVEGGVKITGEVHGLTPNAKHAIHIHEFGDVSSDDGKATGGHYNPQGHDHALADTTEGHAGDLGNLQADGDGNATFEFTAKGVSLDGHHHPVVGRAIIVHAKADDGGQPTGNAGGRIAQGVIGTAK